MHPYAVQRYEAPRRVETHQLERRTPAERGAYRGGHERIEEHGRSGRPEDAGTDTNGVSLHLPATAGTCRNSVQ